MNPIHWILRHFFWRASSQGMSGREAFCRQVGLYFWVFLAGISVVLLRVGLIKAAQEYALVSESTKRNHTREAWVMPLRGKILDRNGRPVAVSVSYRSVVMDPFRMRSLSQPRREAVLRILRDILGVPLSRLERLSRRKVSLVPVKRAVGSGTASQIHENVRRRTIPGIELVREQIRIYPWGCATRAITGVVRGSREILLQHREKGEYKHTSNLRRDLPWSRLASISGATPQRGIGGVEQSLDGFLAGTPERNRIYLDQYRAPIVGRTSRLADGREACSVVLTIDADWQAFVARLVRETVTEKRARLGMVLVMSARNGEVLAAYSASVANGQMVPDDSQIFTARFEAGSVAKPFIMLYALKLGAINLGDRFDCNVATQIGGKAYADERSYERDLIPEEILAVSSDTGMAQVVARIIAKQGHAPAEDIVQFLKGCGFGENIALCHTVIPKSTIPSPEQWTAVTLSQMSLGYEFDASPFHFVSAYAAFANGGRRVKPRLTKRIIDGQGNVLRDFGREAPQKECFPAHLASLVYGFLKSAVSMEEATGRQAKLEGVAVAGKTGTARRLVNGAYSRRSHNSSFIGILPESDIGPLVIGIFFQDVRKGSDYGGIVCAPLFKKIAEYITGTASGGGDDA